jgi:hypothetical protein
LSGCRSFCQLREFFDPSAHDGALFLRLRDAGGPVGRALETISDHAVYFVGTSDVPVDISSNYASHQHNFREINSLLELENTYDTEDIFFPIPASLGRSELLRNLHQPEDTPVYVLYVYHQVRNICLHFELLRLPLLAG